MRTQGKTIKDNDEIDRQTNKQTTPSTTEATFVKFLVRVEAVNRPLARRSLF